MDYNFSWCFDHFVVDWLEVVDPVCELEGGSQMPGTYFKFAHRGQYPSDPLDMASLRLFGEAARFQGTADIRSFLKGAVQRCSYQERRRRRTTS